MSQQPEETPEQEPYLLDLGVVVVEDDEEGNA